MGMHWRVTCAPQRRPRPCYWKPSTLGPSPRRFTDRGRAMSIQKRMGKQAQLYDTLNLDSREELYALRLRSASDIILLNAIVILHWPKLLVVNFRALTRTFLICRAPLRTFSWRQRPAPTMSLWNTDITVSVFSMSDARAHRIDTCGVHGLFFL
jgi:hypothetical protein